MKFGYQLGKVLWSEDEDQLGKNHPGCVSGIFHALHHQYSHSNVKKIVPYKGSFSIQITSRLSAIYVYITICLYLYWKYFWFLVFYLGNRYTRVSDDEDPFGNLNFLDPESNHILVCSWISEIPFQIPCFLFR